MYMYPYTYRHTHMQLHMCEALVAKGEPVAKRKKALRCLSSPPPRLAEARLAQNTLSYIQVA